MQPVRAWRAAVVAGALVALCVAILYRVREVPNGVVSLLGGPSGGVDRWGGLRVRYTPPPGTEAAIEAYLHGRANVERQGRTLSIELLGVAEDTADDVIDVLTAGGLAMREALEDDWAVRIAADNPLVVDARDAAAGDAGPSQLARLEQDSWRAEDGSSHRTYYLIAPTRQALDAAIAAAKERGVELGADREILYEKIEPRPDARVPRVEWRSYALANEVAIDGAMIESVYGLSDPDTGHPTVFLDFTSEGAGVFCELTAEIIGRKLATVLGGRVHSAPIINTAICGGRASITMGGTDLAARERERDMLVEVLRHGGLPSGGTIEERSWTPPADTRLVEHLGRLLLGLLAGLGAALVVFAAVRFARPVVAARPAFTGAFPWRRLLVTAAAPIALAAGHHVTLPGVNPAEYEHLTRGNDGGASVIALGLSPIVVAFVLVELVALAIPALRWRRHDAAGRIRLGQAVAILAIVLALVHGYLIATYLEYGSFRGGLVDFPGWRFRVLTMISLTAGTLLLAVVAGTITEHGLGNGYGVLAATGIAFEIVPDLDFVDPFTASYALELAVFAALVIAANCVLRWRVVERREPALRLPLTGVSPLADTGAFLMLVLTMTGFSFGFEFFRIVEWSTTLSSPKVKLALVAISIPLWAWLFARPQVIERVALQAGLDRPSRATWLRALALSALLVLGGSLATTISLLEISGPLLSAVGAFVVAAVILDVIGDARARRAQLAIAGIIHQAQYLGVVEHVLGEASIPYHAHAGHLRALLAFFGPWVPIRILVPEEHVMVARLKLDEALRAARGSVPEARAV